MSFVLKENSGVFELQTMHPYKADPSQFPRAGIISRAEKRKQYADTPKTVRLAARQSKENSLSPRS